MYITPVYLEIINEKFNRSFNMKINRDKSNSELIKVIKGITYILLFFTIIYSVLYIKNFNKVNYYILSIFKNDDYLSSDYINKSISKKQVYEEIHSMANTLIVAVDNEIWGQQNIKDKDVDRLISIIINSEYNDKDVLLGILYRWKSNDFSQGVFDHNYVWNKLGGTLGKAIELKDIYK